MQRILLTALVSLLAVSAGCTGLITGETVEFEANNATVSDGALDSTGYEAENYTQRSISRDVSVADQERTIRVINQIHRYTKDGTLADATGNDTLSQAVESGLLSETTVPAVSQFVVVASPGAEMAGQTLNPAGEWSNERVLEQVASQTGQLEDIEKDRVRTATSLGASRNVTTFNATTEKAGQEIDVRAHVASFEHAGDVIIVVGVHPQAMDEEENVDELLGGLEHSGN
jgi:hypothetical protein